MCGHSPSLDCQRIFFPLSGPTSGLLGRFHFEKAAQASYAGKTRRSQQRGNVSARADVPPLRWRPIPQSPTATKPNAARCHGSYSSSSSSSFCCVFWHLWQVSFSFLLGRKGFGLVRDRSGSMELSKEPQAARPGYEGEEEEPGTAACSIQETGKVATVTAARLGFTHTAGGGRNAGTRGQTT